MYKKNSTTFLDGLRGIAAFQVLVGHLRALTWEGYQVGFLQHPELYSTLDKLMMYFFSLFRYGHQMVIFFFILSGFVIHLKYANSLKEGKRNFDYKEYLLKRVKRIYPVWIFVMLLALVIDNIGILLELPIYGNLPKYPLVDAMVYYDHSWQVFIGNLFFLQTLWVKIWGTTVPVWSLVLEWWFYMLYPLLWFAIRKSILLATSIVIVLYVLVTWLPPGFLGLLEPLRNVFLTFPMWWLGVLLADAYVERLKITLLIFAPFSLLLPMAVLPNSLWLKVGLTINLDFLQADLTWALGFMGLIALLFIMQSKGLSLKLLEKLQPLGDISYSLYIVHYPIAVFIGGLVLLLGNGIYPTHSWYLLISTLVILPICYLVHLFVEKPFIKRK